MADTFVQVAPDSTGAKIDNSDLTVGANTVLRQRISLADQSTAAAVAAVKAAQPATADYGLVTRGLDPDVVTTGSITTTDLVVAVPPNTGALLSGTPTAGSYVSAQCPGGDSTFTIQATGHTGSLYPEGSMDSTNGIDGNWISLAIRRVGILNTLSHYLLSTVGMIRGSSAGMKWIRIRASGAFTGTAAIVISFSDGQGIVALDSNLPTGTNNIGNVKRTIDLNRNQTNYFMATPILSTTAEVMMLLTGYKGGAAVAETATPAVVTTGRTYRITNIVMEHKAIASLTGVMFRLRANTAGVAIVSSPLVTTFTIGPTIGTIGVQEPAVSVPFPEGIEFAAGTGIALGMVGISTTGQAGTAGGYGRMSILGYEYL